jgi:hypothetical protein
MINCDHFLEFNLQMDRSWMYEMRRDSEEYLVRVEEFLQFAESYRVLQKEANILCPCRDCKNCIGFEDFGRN